MAVRCKTTAGAGPLRIEAWLVGLLLAALAGAPAAGKIRAAEPGVGQILQKPESPFPLDLRWTLVELNGKPIGGDQPTFMLDDKFRAAGYAGCNTYSLTLYPARGQKLLAGAIARTRNSCEKNRDLLEQVFLIALHSVPVWRLDNGELIITSKTTTLRFRRGL